MERRKIEEIEFHNRVRAELLKDAPDRSKIENANTKFYHVARYGRIIEKNHTKLLIKGKKVLDYCCGMGWQSVGLAVDGAKEVVGIDISDVSVEVSKKKAQEAGVGDKCRFFVMDAENLTFENGSFDVVWGSGILHHLDLEKAYREIARVLKPDGVAIFTEGLRHNPAIQAYRRRTPNLRTPHEVDHILGKPEIFLARKYFKKVNLVGCFYLFTLLAAPFRSSMIFGPLLKALETIDKIILKIPGLRWLAWMAVFELSSPKQLSTESSHS